LKVGKTAWVDFDSLPDNFEWVGSLEWVQQDMSTKVESLNAQNDELLRVHNDISTKLIAQNVMIAELTRAVVASKNTDGTSNTDE
jgi:hypothetical protein